MTRLYMLIPLLHPKSELTKIWKPVLKRELDSLFNDNTPVFVTASELLQSLAKEYMGTLKRTLAMTLHTDSPSLETRLNEHFYVHGRFINPENNFLNRKIIPMFRHPKYDLNKQRWSSYLDKIQELFRYPCNIKFQGRSDIGNG